MMNFFFGEPEKPLKDQAREWNRQLDRSMRQMDNDIAKIKQDEKKVQNELRKYAKEGQMTAVKNLAKGLIQSRKARERFMLTKVNMNSVKLSLNMAVSDVKVGQVIKSSTGLMKCMSKLVNVPDLQLNCKDMAKEMAKAGLMQEMMDDAFANMEDPDLDELAEDEVKKVIDEYAADILKGGGGINKTNGVEEKEVAVNKEGDVLQARFATL